MTSQEAVGKTGGEEPQYQWPERVPERRSGTVPWTHVPQA